MTEQEAILSLNAIPGLGNARIRELIQYFGSAKKVFDVKRKIFIEENILSPGLISKIYHFERDKFLKNEYNLLKKYNANIVTETDEEYPQSLNTIVDAPVVLYYKGNLSADDQPAIAMVGSRRASLYGLTVAEKFAAQLSEMGIIIISGLARGIDTAAHRACLKVKGRTFAVLGSGLAQMYPAENKELAERVAAGGAVISEFPLTTPPLAFNFPRRNRIVSGLSLGVVVVEAGSRSGALITARCGIEQGRDVFAVPGPVNHPNVQGVHSLIQQGAKLCGSVQDILEELRLPIRSMISKPQNFDDTRLASIAADLNEKERDVYCQISHDPIYIDELASKCEVSVNDIMGNLLSLELKSKVKQIPGKYFVRV